MHLSDVKEQNPNVVFRIVTDDPEAAFAMFPEDRMMYCYSDNNPVNDFRRLKSANYLVLNNSSFSWWAAYLNQNAKTIIAPSRWFNYNKNYDKAGLGKTEANNNDWYPADIENDFFTWI